MPLVIWLAGMVILSACRLVLYWSYRNSPTRYSDPEKWNFWFMTTLFLSGILWGSVAVFLFPADSIGHQAFIAFVTGGMVAGAVGAFTAVISAFFIFSIPALLPIGFRLFLIGGEMHVAMGAMIFLFLLIISLTAIRMHRDIAHLMSLKYERSVLIADLQQEVDQRKEAEENLRRQKVQVEEIVAQRTAQLQNANQRLQAIFSYAPLIIWVIDQEGILIFCDGKGLEKIGFAPGGMVGKSVFKLYAKNRLIIDITQRVLAGEFISDTINIEDVFFEIRYQPMVEADDRLAGAIGVAIDVTDQTAAKEALRKSEEKYRELVENINDVLYAVDREGMIAYVSPVIESVLGYRSDELIGKRFLDYIYHQDRARLKSDFARAIEVAGKPGEYRFLDKAGETKWCRVNSRPISEGDEKIGIQGVLVDISRSKLLEEQLQRAQKMEALGTLAGGVAHDLNNILSGIVSYPDLLLYDLDPDSPLRGPLTTIKKSGQKAAEIVQDLLTLARRSVSTKKVVDLNKTVQDFLSSPEYRDIIAEHENIGVETNLSRNVLKLLGSETHLSKAVMNLVQNAVDAMPAGGTLTLATRGCYVDAPFTGFETIPLGEYTLLEVGDTGIGMPPSDLEKIFEPFYTKKVLGRSGTGLGMSVVWGTVKDHEGYIDIATAEGTGTTFSLYFPASRLEIEAQPAVYIEDYLGNGESILVIDDAKEQRDLAKRMMQRLGYEVFSAGSGEEAVQQVRERSFDLLILDMIMPPGIDGLETYRRILQIAPGQKAVIASGFSQTENVKEARRLGADSYVKKPFTLENIGLAVRKALNPEARTGK
jgi:PAS domain S-box-containing protein